MMGDLPIERINPCRAFEKVGIDFAGPITTKCQHTRKANTTSSLTSASSYACVLKRCTLNSYLHYQQQHFCQHCVDLFHAVAIHRTFILTTAAVLNFEELDTIVCQIEACINSRPLYPLSSDPKDLQVLTPGHFLIGCPLLELPDHNLTNQSLSIHSRWSLLMKLKMMFWSLWQLSYLNTLQSRAKWMQSQKDLTVGYLLLIKNPASFSTRWTPGRIVATHPAADGICRVVTIQTSSGVMTRPVSQVAVLPLPPSTTSSRPPEDVKNS
ncbi:integrase catalytic domain-containing protein [Trichonephila clavipes]|nr:integrase catalytic domain-containing protein [Trichonephila clavipes]